MIFLDRSVQVEAILEDIVTSDPRFLSGKYAPCNFCNASMGETRTLKDIPLRKKESSSKVLVLYAFVWLYSLVKAVI